MLTYSAGATESHFNMFSLLKRRNARLSTLFTHNMFHLVDILTLFEYNVFNTLYEGRTPKLFSYQCKYL